MREIAPTTRPQPAAGTLLHHRVQLLASRFRYAGRKALFGKARLYGDRIELASWHLLGLQTRSIQLDHVAHMDYHHLRNGSNLSVYLDDGEVLELELEEAHVWRQYFENWLWYEVLPSAKLTGEAEEALALSG